MQAAGSAAKAMGANVKLAEAMGSTAQTMGQMNRMMNPAQVELFLYEIFALKELTISCFISKKLLHLLVFVAFCADLGFLLSPNPSQG